MNKFSLMKRFFDNLSKDGKHQFVKVYHEHGEEGQEYLLKQAIEFNKVYPREW